MMYECVDESMILLVYVSRYGFEVSCVDRFFGR